MRTPDTEAPFQSASGSHYGRNKDLLGLRCLRCERSYQLDDPHIDSGLGCGSCLEQGFPVGLYCVYEQSAELIIDRNKAGLRRFASKLPFCEFPSLGEGNTPLVPLENIAGELGLQSVWIKNEGQNPTGSHKDRMSPFAVARARSAGFDKVIASSSGNAGASLASYAARAGLRCRIIAEHNISPSWANAIRVTGAELELVDGNERWPLMKKLVQEERWFPVTNFWPQPVGSNPFGIDGYKTISYEIVEQFLQALAPLPTVVIVPTCRGDMLFGIWRGFVEAQQSGSIGTVPRLVAAEPGARLEHVLTGNDYRSVFNVPPNSMTSIDGGTATYQSWKALSESGGTAVSIGNSDAFAAQRSLAENGFYVELSSAASLAVLRHLHAKGLVTPKDSALIIATSHGYKEPPNLTPAQQTLRCN